MFSFKKTFSETKKILIEEEDKDDKYTISIFLCLLHEILKLVLKEKKINSPNIINDPYNKYNELRLEKAESGRILEYYINKDINKIEFLKFSFIPKSKLNDYKLWIDKDFNKINIIIEQLMEDNSKQYLNYGLNYFPTYNKKK